MVPTVFAVLFGQIVGNGMPKSNAEDEISGWCVGLRDPTG